MWKNDIANIAGEKSWNIDSTRRTFQSGMTYFSETVHWSRLYGSQLLDKQLYNGHDLN